MDAWNGGPCPECGEEVPAKMLRCTRCRAWLNPKLTRPEPAVPEFFPLPEITAGTDTAAAALGGHYVVCPACRRELRVADHYAGQSVGCRFCDHKFPLTFESEGPQRLGVYVSCPNCGDELRAAAKYLGREVICKHCDGRLVVGQTPA